MRAELGHLVCYSWNSGCPCHSERAAALQGHSLPQHLTAAAAAAMALSCALSRYTGTPRQSLSRRRERTVAAGHSTHRFLSCSLLSPQAPALVTNPCSARARNRNSSAQSQTSGSSPKHGSHPAPAQLTAQGNTCPWALDQPHCAPSLITCV